MNPIQQLRTLSGPFFRLRTPGTWFYVALGLGAGLRLFYALFTTGTSDALVWEAFGLQIHEQGLIATYRDGVFQFNHPPPIGWVVGALSNLAQKTGIPFAALFRLPFALVDAGTAWLLFRCLSQARNTNLRTARYAGVALYWVYPLSAVFSAYHGNTDTAVAFFLAAAALCVARNRGGWAGALIGLSIWIKLPGLLGAPILFLALPNWKQRFRFCAAAVAVGVVGYSSVLIKDPEAVVRAVFLYGGLRIQTTTGLPIWGIQSFYPQPSDLSPDWRPLFLQFRSFLYQWHTVITVGPMLAFAFLKPRRQEIGSILGGIAGSYLIIYGLSNLWSFQYLAWSLPFWLTLGFRWAAPAYLVILIYVYGLYAWLCGNWLLLGEWDFIHKGHWPPILIAFRNISVLVFLWIALSLIWQASRERLQLWRGYRLPSS